MFRRSYSKSSLDIGMRPIDGGVVKMELHHFNKIHEGMGIKRANINPGIMAAGKLHTYFDLFVCMGTLRSF